MTTRRSTLADFTSRLTDLAAAIAARDPDGVDYTLRLAVAETLYLFHDRLRSEDRAFDRAAFIERLDQARVMVDRLDAVRAAPGVARVERPPYEIYVADLYSRCWAKYDDPQFDATIDMFAERFALNGVGLERFEGVEALDAGCGSGRYTMAMAKLGARHAHGVDLSERAVREASARARRMGYGDRVSFAQRSVIDLPAEWTNRFDFVCSNGVVHHTPDPIKGLAEIARVLKPGGEAFIMVYGKGGSFWALTDFCREILTPVPLDVADAYLELRATPVGKIFFCLDHWYTQYQERVTLKEFESRLAAAGFTEIRYLPRARVYDASERMARYPEEADIIEDPDMRYLARKTQ
ncbi:MAG TPA: methyltransferase domain-containing protein [Vicinamibacterales bacterium]|nr:methyltransferase domain-containing protein [Vicinamibacterales bacterium]